MDSWIYREYYSTSWKPMVKIPSWEELAKRDEDNLHGVQFQIAGRGAYNLKRCNEREVMPT